MDVVFTKHALKRIDERFDNIAKNESMLLAYLKASKFVKPSKSRELYKLFKYGLRQGDVFYAFTERVGKKKKGLFFVLKDEVDILIVITVVKRNIASDRLFGLLGEKYTSLELKKTSST